VSFGSNLGFKLTTITGYESFYMPGSIFLAGGDLEVTSNASAYPFVNKTILRFLPHFDSL
jgi:hypothetical protein